MSTETLKRAATATAEFTHQTNAAAEFLRQFQATYLAALEVKRARAWASWYVRGALAPEYATEAAVHTRAQEMLRASEPLAAAALLTGWATRPVPVCACPMVPDEPVWSEPHGRILYPAHREWSFACPVIAHRDVAASISVMRHGPVGGAA